MKVFALYQDCACHALDCPFRWDGESCSEQMIGLFASLPLAMAAAGVPSDDWAEYTSEGDRLDGRNWWDAQPFSIEEWAVISYRSSRRSEP